MRLAHSAAAGEASESHWRYSLQWRRVVEAITMRDPPDFRRVANAIYPNVKPEEARSHSHGAPSKHLSIETHHRK